MTQLLPNVSSDERRELLDLAARLCHGESTSSDERRVEAIVAQRSNGRDAWSKAVELVAGLHWRFSNRDESNPLALNASEPLPTPRPARRDPPAPVIEPTAKPVALPVRTWRGSEWMRLPTVWAVVAASFCIYFGILLWNMREARTPSAKPGSSPVAEIKSSNDVHWVGDSPDADKLDIEIGKALAIESGIVEIKLKQGTTLVIEGPATWSIEGDNAAQLVGGKLVAYVPKRAVGFTLQTRCTKIVDLGTEFGVEVPREGPVHVRVFKGKVELIADKNPDEAPGAPQVVTAGQVARVESPKTEPVVESADVAPAKAFVRNLATPSLVNEMIVCESFSSRPNFATIDKADGGYGFGASKWTASSSQQAHRNGGLELPKGAAISPQTAVDFLYEDSEAVARVATASRKLSSALTLGGEQDIYLSVLGRRYGSGVIGVVGFVDAEKNGLTIGWRPRQPDKPEHGVAFDLQTANSPTKTAQFAVIRYPRAKSANQNICIKLYQPTDTIDVPATNAGDNWAPVGGWTLTAPSPAKPLDVDRIMIESGGAQAYIQFDEIRVGTTWQVVTGSTSPAK